MTGTVEQDALLRTIERLKTEQEALRQENRYLRRQQQVLQSNRSNLVEIQRIAGIADIVVYEVNAMSNQLHCPDSTISVFGILDDDASLEDLFRVIHPEDRRRFERHYADALIDGEPHRGTHRIVLSDGTTRVVHHHIKTFMALNGLPIKTVGLIQDITERQRIETELAAALRRAEAATKAKSAFLTNMSHEIRTPLHGVMGLAQIMQTTELSPSQKDYIDNILISSHTLLDLINDILDLGKIEAEKMELEVTEFKLDDLLSALSVLFRSITLDKTVELRIERDPRVPSTLVGDPLRVRQVLTNLVSNAVKFTERGHVAIAVEAIAVSEHEVSVRFIVRDTGIGIPTDKLDTLFDSFTQADDSTTRRYGGTGLGLAICRHLVTLMGGQLGAQSVVGHGSTFWTTLRFGRAQSLAATRCPTPDDHPLQPDALVGAKILVVEDNAVNRKVAGHLLRKSGIDVDYAHDGIEALSMVESHAYDLVLMDMQMPRMDGYEATRRIREDGRSALPIIAMTAHTMVGDRDKCLQAGADDYIAKPVRFAPLLALLLKVIGRCRRRAQGASGSLGESTPGGSGERRCDGRGA
ncbi:MAG: response regulator [Myxococcota bacterium]